MSARVISNSLETSEASLIICFSVNGLVSPSRRGRAGRGRRGPLPSFRRECGRYRGSPSGTSEPFVDGRPGTGPLGLTDARDASDPPLLDSPPVQVQVTGEPLEAIDAHLHV